MKDKINGKIMFSIIIPTLNEENYLPSLFQCLEQERFLIKEIIVADAGSKDKTKEIAKNFGATIVKGGLSAQGRNNGAKVAKGHLFLFLDADLKLSPNFLENTQKEFKRKQLDIASFPLLPQENKFLFNNFTFNFTYNFLQKKTSKFFPLGAAGILAKRDIWEKIGGFDPEIKLAEDHYFCQKGAKFGKFGQIESSKIYISLRRFERDGYFLTLLKYLVCGLHMITVGPVKSDIIKYRFNHYDHNRR